MAKNRVIIVDPFSTGALLAPELENKGYQCLAVISSNNIPSRFTNSYNGAGFADKNLYGAVEVKEIVKKNEVLAVIAGAETGVYCAEELAYHYRVKSNNHTTTDWRRKKSAMQERIKHLNLQYIESKKINKENCYIEDLSSINGYVIKPDGSCMTDGVFFFDSKEKAKKWIANIDWEAKNAIGEKNEHFLVQEKLNGDEYIVDLVINYEDAKVCALCRYKKGLHNSSHFVYESLEVLDVNDKNYENIIKYAIDCAGALGVEFGLAHIEIMNTYKGPILIELGARLHGGIAPSVFESCYHPGLLTSAINLIAENFNIEPCQLVKKGRIVFLINEVENLLVNNLEVVKAKISSLAFVKHIKFFCSEGAVLSLTTDLSNCPGIVSIIANGESELDNIEFKIRDYFKHIGVSDVLSKRN